MGARSLKPHSKRPTSLGRTVLGLVGGDDGEPCGSHTITTAELAALNERFGVGFDSGGREVRLERWRSLRRVPYLVHTGYELALLLDGTKPFARMAEEYPPHQHHDEDRFERYVENGVLHKEVALQPFPAPIRSKDGREFAGIREVYYARKGEEWRIPAWKLIWAAAQKSGWSEEFERLEGMLYGYEEWQIEWWLTHRQNLAPIAQGESR
jgi:hypothetical protein